MVDRSLEALVGGNLVVVAVVVEEEVVVGDRRGRRLGGHGLVDRGGGRVATGGAQRLVLEARDLAGVGAVAPLELEMFLDRVVEQSHGVTNPTTQAAIYSRGEPSARTVRFLPARLAR